MKHCTFDLEIRHRDGTITPIPEAPELAQQIDMLLSQKCELWRQYESAKANIPSSFTRLFAELYQEIQDLEKVAQKLYGKYIENAEKIKK